MSTLGDVKIGRIVDASEFVQPVSMRSINFDDWQRSSASVMRGLVPLMHGEEQPLAAFWLPPPWLSL